MINPATSKDVREALTRYGLHPQKRWGQNFLVDKNILLKIGNAARLDAGEFVAEIGPGLGALTRELAGRCRGVLAVDIDRHLEEPLIDYLSDLPGVHLLFHDVLTLSLEQALMDSFQLQELNSFSVCANIPYNITSPIIFKLLEECPKLRIATLMMQKEVAARIAAPPGGKEYGVLTLMTSYYAEIKYLMDVSRNCFYPRPEVDSAVVQLVPHRIKPVQVQDEKRFKELIRKAFQKRRKTILNICADYSGMEKKRCEAILVDLKINPSNRPENLGLKEFALLAETLSQ